MPDIRSFFTPRGGAAPKPTPAKSEEPPKGKRTSELLRTQFNRDFSKPCVEGRRVVEDSDDDEAFQ